MFVVGHMILNESVYIEKNSQFSIIPSSAFKGLKVRKEEKNIVHLWSI